MTERRSVSNERNAPRATIGKGGQSKSREEMTPGPQAYDTVKARKHIGDDSSVKICFAMQVRPISAKAGELKPVRGPGP